MNTLDAFSLGLGVGWGLGLLFAYWRFKSQLRKRGLLR